MKYRLRKYLEKNTQDGDFHGKKSFNLKYKKNWIISYNNLLGIKKKNIL